jgi:hypothetical protein
MQEEYYFGVNRAYYFGVSEPEPRPAEPSAGGGLIIGLGNLFIHPLALVRWRIREARRRRRHEQMLREEADGWMLAAANAKRSLFFF